MELRSYCKEEERSYTCPQSPMSWAAERLWGGDSSLGFEHSSPERRENISLTSSCCGVGREEKNPFGN